MSPKYDANLLFAFFVDRLLWQAFSQHVRVTKSRHYSVVIISYELFYHVLVLIQRTTVHWSRIVHML